MKLLTSLIVVLLFTSFAIAQEKAGPDFAVSGLKLFDRASAKTLLDGYQARIGDDGRPFYHFYNKHADQVLKLTGASADDRFLIVAIEVYEVDESYTAVHFQNEKIGTFKTEKSVFVGYRQSNLSAVLGVPNVDGKDTVGPKTIEKKIGTPTEKLVDGKKEIFVYKFADVELTDDAGKSEKFAYEARYEFLKGKLKRFSMSISK